MIKKQRKRKISINAMLILVDVVLLILMTQDIYVKHILAYGMIRVALTPFIYTVVVNFKLLTTIYKFFGGRKVISRIRKIFTTKEYTSEDLKVRSRRIFELDRLLIGSLLLMFLFLEVMYKLMKLVSYIIDEWMAASYSPNAHFVLIGVILVNIALECIRYYMNSKCEYVLSLPKTKKDMAAQYIIIKNSLRLSHCVGATLHFANDFVRCSKCYFLA